MDDSTIPEDSVTVDPTERTTLRRHLERFSDPQSVTEGTDGTLTARFSPSTYIAVGPDGHVRTGMPLHAFDGPAKRLHFDYGDGELHVATGEEAISYTFRRP